jgi:hypothetical protein
LYALKFELSVRGYEVSYLLMLAGLPLGGVVTAPAESLPPPPPHPTRKTVAANINKFFMATKQT